MQRITIEDKLIVYLSMFPKFKFETGPVPPSITQEGIAKGIGVSRNYVAVVLNRMSTANRKYVTSELRYVAGSKRRKVYFLTREGERRAQGIIEKVKDENVRVILPDGNVINLVLSNIGKYIRGRNAIARGIILMDKYGNINLQRGTDTYTLVGRREELETFENVISNLSEERCVLIHGAPGFGKTSLAMKFGESAKQRGFLFLRGMCYEKMDIPYFPYLYMFDGCKNNRTCARILKYLKSLGAKNKVKGEEERTALWYDISQELRNMSRESPLVLLMDDFHRAGETSIELTKFLIKNLRDCPVIFIFTSPENIEAFLTETCGKNTTSIQLRPLNEDEIDEILKTIFRKSKTRRLAEKILLVTEGNPLFVREIIDSMAQMGASRNIRNASLFVENLPAPRRFEDALLSRVSLLSPESRRILEMASVVGLRFTEDMLRKIAEDGNLKEHLDALVEEGFIENMGGGKYKFHHPMVQLTIYNKVNERTRKVVHLKVADAAEELAITNPEIGDVINIGFHYQRAGKCKKAIEHYLLKAKKAGEQMAFEEQISILELAYEIGKSCNYRVKIILEKLGDLHTRMGNYDTAIRRYAELLNMGIDERGKIHLKMAQVYRQMGDFEGALTCIEEGLKSGDGIAHIKLLSEKMWILLRRGEIEAVKNILRDMEKISKNANNDNYLEIYYEDLATFYHYSGEPEKALQILEKVVRIKREMKDESGLAIIYTNIGILLAQMGRVEEGIEYFEKSRKIDEKLGNLRGLAQSLSNLGIAHRKLGNYRQALDFFGRAVDIYERIGSRDSLAIAYFNMGNCHMDLGNFKISEEYLLKSKSIFEKINDLWGLCYAHRSLGELNEYIEDYAAEMNHLIQALSIAKRTNNRDCMIDAYLSMASAYIKTEEFEVAKAIIEKVSNFIGEGSSQHGELELLKGEIEQLQKNYQEAEKHIKNALNIFENIGEDTSKAKAMCHLAILMEKTGRDGRGYMKKAHSIFENKNMRYWTKLCEEKVLIPAKI